MMELNKCKCGEMPEVIIARNPYEPTGCFVGKVICKNCMRRTRDYGLLDINREFLIKKWNEGNIYFIDELYSEINSMR